MGPCPQSVSDKTGPAMGAYNYRGDQGKGAGALSAHGLTKAGPVRGCMRSAAIRKSGVVLASASMASAGLSYVSIRPAPMAASIARMTESIDRRLSTTATASVARSRPRARWYATHPPYRLSRADQATGRLANRASIVLLKGGEIASKNGVSLQSPHRLSTLLPQDGPQPLVVW